MPLIIEGGRVPSRWAEKESRAHSHFPLDQCIRLALVNNMPDPALEDTELQFFDLLDIASGDVPVLIQLYSLTGVPRTDRGQRHLNSFYSNCDELWHTALDGVIITGTEPRQPDLRDEPYWAALTHLFDWAAENTISTVLSCLAAHASVLHSDNIGRHRLPDKQFGVYESTKTSSHALTAGQTGAFRFPHSRWNEVRANELQSAGYEVLTQSADAGVDLFVKKKKKSLFVHFQGHPEYGALTLLKEYRRDIKRYLLRERETYPTMPAGYFDPFATQLLTTFRDKALSARHEDIMEFFPESAIVNALESTWHPTAIGIYRNWLQHIIARKAETASFIQTTTHNSHRNPSPVS